MNRATNGLLINGAPCTGTQAEAHFVAWALAPEQEKLDGCPRTAQDAVRVFQHAIFNSTLVGSRSCWLCVACSGITKAE